MAYIHTVRRRGDIMRSADWNTMGHAIEQLQEQMEHSQTLVQQLRQRLDDESMPETDDGADAAAQQDLQQVRTECNALREQLQQQEKTLQQLQQTQLHNQILIQLLGGSGLQTAEEIAEALKKPLDGRIFQLGDAI